MLVYIGPYLTGQNLSMLLYYIEKGGWKQVSRTKQKKNLNKKFQFRNVLSQIKYYISLYSNKQLQFNLRIFYLFHVIYLLL